MKSVQIMGVLLMATAILAPHIHARNDNPAADPQPREPQWCKDSHVVLNRKAAQGGFETMLIGDSVSWEWEANESTGRKVWDQLKEFKPATFAVSGDRTEHVLWRLLNGNLDVPAPPKTVVLLIGTNNTGQRKDTPEQIAGGIEVILAEITKKFPSANVLVYGIFPTGVAPNNPNRNNNDATNALIAGLCNGKQVRYVNINDRFLNPDGTLREEFFRDGLHLSAAGYQIWADSLKQEIP